MLSFEAPNLSTRSPCVKGQGSTSSCCPSVSASPVKSPLTVTRYRAERPAPLESSGPDPVWTWHSTPDLTARAISPALFPPTSRLSHAMLYHPTLVESPQAVSHGKVMGSWDMVCAAC